MLSEINIILSKLLLCHPRFFRAVGKLFAQARPFNDKICTLKLRDPEIAALSAIVLWSLIGECTNNECFETYRDRIFAELHEEMLEEYGEGEAPTRQMELAHLLSSLNVSFWRERGLIQKLERCLRK